MTADESAMLNPRIEEIVGREEAAVIVAELGTELRLESLQEYTLAQGAALASCNVEQMRRLPIFVSVLALASCMQSSNAPSIPATQGAAATKCYVVKQDAGHRKGYHYVLRMARQLAAW